MYPRGFADVNGVGNESRKSKYLLCTNNRRHFIFTGRNEGTNTYRCWWWRYLQNFKLLISNLTTPNDASERIISRAGIFYHERGNPQLGSKIFLCFASRPRRGGVTLFLHLYWSLIPGPCLRSVCLGDRFIPMHSLTGERGWPHVSFSLARSTPALHSPGQLPSHQVTVVQFQIR
ncbi:hypothetical protein BV22DRAFT_259656 [Leucogyrophana mollusca]|uniref:Uncharacterized protein n=1 Tax=Leucogyrophana mollusca TaxID=85980 RepID=A0ACB8BQ91_9AGAM|nr:hypothetical protein BV22DRAFT_259656 [Leucogyrophana mollusca]